MISLFSQPYAVFPDQNIVKSVEVIELCRKELKSRIIQSGVRRLSRQIYDLTRLKLSKADIKLIFFFLVEEIAIQIRNFVLTHQRKTVTIYTENIF